MTSSSWDLQLTHSSAWIDAHLGEFYVDRALDQVLPSVKAVAELAHTGEILTRLPEPRWRDLGQRWLDHAWRATDEGEIVQKLVRANPKLVLAATLLVPFHLAGRTRPDAMRAVEEQHLLAALNGYEWGLVVNALRALGIEPSEDVVERARAASTLTTRPPPAGLSLEHVYLLIHECLYLSRWGADKMWCDAEQSAYLEAALPALVERFCQAGDADVVAELALATHTRPFLCVEPRAWELIGARQEDDGGVAPPPRAVTFLRRDDESFARRYHTTLVASMAWALCPHAP